MAKNKEKFFFFSQIFCLLVLHAVYMQNQESGSTDSEMLSIEADLELLEKEAQKGLERILFGRSNSGEHNIQNTDIRIDSTIPNLENLSLKKNHTTIKKTHSREKKVNVTNSNQNNHPDFKNFFTIHQKEAENHDPNKTTPINKQIQNNHKVSTDDKSTFLYNRSFQNHSNSNKNSNFDKPNASKTPLNTIKNSDFPKINCLKNKYPPIKLPVNDSENAETGYNKISDKITNKNSNTAWDQNKSNDEMIKSKESGHRPRKNLVKSQSFDDKNPVVFLNLAENKSKFIDKRAPLLQKEQEDLHIISDIDSEDESIKKQNSQENVEESGNRLYPCDNTRDPRYAAENFSKKGNDNFNHRIYNKNKIIGAKNRDGFKEKSGFSNTNYTYRSLKNCDSEGSKSENNYRCSNAYIEREMDLNPNDEVSTHVLENKVFYTKEKPDEYTDSVSVTRNSDSGHRVPFPDDFISENTFGIENAPLYDERHVEKDIFRKQYYIQTTQATSKNLDLDNQNVAKYHGKNAGNPQHNPSIPSKHKKISKQKKDTPTVRSPEKVYENSLNDGFSKYSSDDQEQNYLQISKNVSSLREKDLSPKSIDDPLNSNVHKKSSFNTVTNNQSAKRQSISFVSRKNRMDSNHIEHNIRDEKHKKNLESGTFYTISPEYKARSSETTSKLRNNDVYGQSRIQSHVKSISPRFNNENSFKNQRLKEYTNDSKNNVFGSKKHRENDKKHHDPNSINAKSHQSKNQNTNHHFENVYEKDTSSSFVKTKNESRNSKLKGIEECGFEEEMDRIKQISELKIVISKINEYLEVDELLQIEMQMKLDEIENIIKNFGL